MLTGLQAVMHFWYSELKAVLSEICPSSKWPQPLSLCSFGSAGHLRTWEPVGTGMSGAPTTMPTPCCLYQKSPPSPQAPGVGPPSCPPLPRGNSAQPLVWPVSEHPTLTRHVEVLSPLRAVGPSGGATSLPGLSLFRVPSAILSRGLTCHFSPLCLGSCGQMMPTWPAMSTEGRS